MSTRWYLQSSPDTTPITPTPDSAWEDTSILARANTTTTPSNDAFSSQSYSDLAGTDYDQLFHQWISEELTPGQTITGLQSVKAQVRCSETSALNNQFLALGIRILNGTTVQKTVLPVTRDDVEAATSLTNRQFTATSNSGDYTTVSGDRVVIEMGMGGNSVNHSTSMRFGDPSSGSDLAEDDTSTSDDRPWVQLNDTLTFGGGGGPSTAQIFAAMQPPLSRSKVRDGRVLTY
jgi:hypothetical protein